jgi:hypothetical protein
MGCLKSVAAFSRRHRPFCEIVQRNRLHGSARAKHEIPLFLMRLLQKEAQSAKSRNLDASRLRAGLHEVKKCAGSCLLWVRWLPFD